MCTSKLRLSVTAFAVAGSMALPALASASPIELASSGAALTAASSSPTHHGSECRQYTKDWKYVRFETPYSPGRNVCRQGRSDRAASKADILASESILRDYIHAYRVSLIPVPGATVGQTLASESNPQVVSTGLTTASETGAPSGLAACIIRHESGGNPGAVNGQYGGIGQWNANSWAQYGGTRYASSPTGATYQQQLSVLLAEGPAGMRQQQAQYDGC